MHKAEVYNDTSIIALTSVVNFDEMYEAFNVLLHKLLSTIKYKWQSCKNNIKKICLH